MQYLALCGYIYTRAVVGFSFFSSNQIKIGEPPPGYAGGHSTFRTQEGDVDHLYIYHLDHNLLLRDAV